MTAVAPVPSGTRFVLHRTQSAEGNFRDDVLWGLSAAHKSLPPRWFYDDLGSALFDAICFLPEYYVMRAETEVLTAHVSEIVEAFGAPARLVELGSGAARKTRILLDAMSNAQSELEYVPVDVDATMLEKVAHDLLADYAGLRISAICSDFARPSIPLAAPGRSRGRTVVLFLGSTIGNLEPDQAVAMFRDLRTALRPGDAVLLGADLRKERSILEAAYDDPLGVTAAFNLNLLQRINRELGGHFDLQTFAHRALYDEGEGRIEMHLDSRRAQTVRIDALDVDVTFAAGESIHTESSYKHDEQTIASLAAASGFTVAGMWMDSRRWFADFLLTAS